MRLIAPVLLMTGLLAGCSGGMIGDHLPSQLGGLPDAVPERPAAPVAYPAVHEMPPPRTNTTLNDDEQKKLEQDLIAARQRTEVTNSTAATRPRPAVSPERP